MSLSLITSITGQGTFLRSRQTLSSSGSSQPRLHSMCESRKVRTSPTVCGKDTSILLQSNKKCVCVCFNEGKHPLLVVCLSKVSKQYAFNKTMCFICDKTLINLCTFVLFNAHVTKMCRMVLKCVPTKPAKEVGFVLLLKVCLHRKTFTKSDHVMGCTHWRAAFDFFFSCFMDEKRSSGYLWPQQLQPAGPG